jgi:DNA transformation protein and related proteins
MLAQAGIDSSAQLKKLGAVEAYRRVVASGQKSSLNLLWALEGALTDRGWKDVARTERLRLLLALEHANK